MDLSNNQMQVIDTPLGINLLIEGLSGVGKTTTLLKKYEQLVHLHKISPNDILFIVSSELKKHLTETKYYKDNTKFNILNIYTINEFIYKYLEYLDLPLFQNTIDENKKRTILNQIVNKKTLDFNLDFIYDEIKFIQNNICLNSNNEIDVVLNKELKHYLVIPRKSIKKGLLSFREKQEIWEIYQEYLQKILNEDLFDEDTFYQSFLRLIYHQTSSNELALTYSHIFIDDIEEFTKVQLDIIYYLYIINNKDHSCYLTIDELKSIDRHKTYKNSLLYQNIDQKVILDINYRNSKNVFNIIKSNLQGNNLFDLKLPYRSYNVRNDLKSILTFFYNKSVDEKREVFFDRLDLLVNNLNYSLRDILVIFNDQNNLAEMTQVCQNNNIKVFNIFEYFKEPLKNGLTFIHKSELQNFEFKVVIIYDADNRKLCTGPINRLINVSNNYIDSIRFYLALGIATDFIIINSSISEPSHLLLPSHIDYQEFVFEIGSKFMIKSTLNINRMSDFIAFITENLTKYYGYQNDDLRSYSLFDIMINLNHVKIGIKILSNDIDNDTIIEILKNSQNLGYIVIFDSHHYLTFKNVNNEFIRVIDIPNK